MAGPYTVELARVRRDGLRQAGGKAAGLGELLAAGFPVPPGFVVTTDAYRDFVRAAGLGGVPVERLGEEIRRAPVPDEIAAAVLAGRHALDAPAVAVRSSGVAEDLPGASFAGQHDSVLDVRGDEALLSALRHCWASLWTPRALAYRRRAGIDGPGAAMAVVVQAMVDAEWAGVMFTADPVGGDRGVVVLEAVPGLADALVSGMTSGHRQVVGKRPHGDDTGPVPPHLVKELVRLGVGVEAAFGGVPQDIEWAYDGRRCLLVQARPLTGLPGPAQGRTRPGEAGIRHATRPGPLVRSKAGRRFLAFGADHIPIPPYPMDVSLSLRPAVDAILGFARRAGLRTPATGHVLTELAEGVVQVVPPRIRLTPRAIPRLPGALAAVVRAARTRPEEWRADCDAILVPLLDATEIADLSALPDAELLARLDEIRHAQGRLLPARFGCVIPRAAIADGLLRAALRAAAGRDADRLHAGLLAAIPCATTRGNAELARLAARVRDAPGLRACLDPRHVADDPEERAFRAGIDAYLRRYGSRQTSVPLIGFPPIRENPGALHALIATMADAPYEPQDTDRAARARRELAGAPGLRARLMRPLLLRLTETVRAGVAVREDSHFQLFMRGNAAARRLLLELGGRLTRRGTLDAPEDVFHLEAAELTGEAVRDTVARRKKARAAVLDGYTMFPAALMFRGGSAPGDEHALRGVPAARGVATGPVRVVRGEEGFGSLAEGEILVCPYTNPSWTPLFSLARAVVADTGGVASHAAIVAREYGIPAVMATGDGTRRLTDGQRVRVDGDTGTVTVLDHQ